MHSKHDYIPTSDADFDVWQSIFLSALEARRAELGLTEAEWAALRAESDGWKEAYAEHVRAHSAALTASRAKTDSRAGYSRSLRAAVKRVQAHPSLTEPDCAALGITIRRTSRTKAPAPSTRPEVHVDISQRLRHTIHFRDSEAQNPRAKPRGVRACEIWVKVGDKPPGDASDMTLLTYATATPYVAIYGAEAAGKVAHYMLRWANSRGEKGPWSQTASTTVAV